MSGCNYTLKFIPPKTEIMSTPLVINL